MIISDRLVAPSLFMCKPSLGSTFWIHIFTILQGGYIHLIAYLDYISREWTVSNKYCVSTWNYPRIEFHNNLLKSLWIVNIFNSHCSCVQNMLPTFVKSWNFVSNKQHILINTSFDPQSEKHLDASFIVSKGTNLVTEFSYL